jgi:hypothetical protein
MHRKTFGAYEICKPNRIVGCAPIASMNFAEIRIMMLDT